MPALKKTHTNKIIVTCLSTSVEAAIQDQLLWFSVKKKLKRYDATTQIGPFYLIALFSWLHPIHLFVLEIITLCCEHLLHKSLR